MEREKTDAEWLSDAKTSLEDLISWSDELPDQFIIGNPAYARHKFRGNWFQGVMSNVLLVADICGDEQLMQDANSFIKRRHEKGIKNKTTREEINEADQLIKRAMEKLKNIS